MKRIKDTRLGEWLKNKSPEVFETFKDALPNSGVTGLIKNMLGSDDPEVDRLIEEARNSNVTERWRVDMGSDSPLSKNIRPLALITLLLFYLSLAFMDSISSLDFDVKDSYIELLEVLSLTAFGAYFAGRSFEKTKRH